MYFRVIAVGRLRESYLAAAAADFRKRLVPHHRLEEIEVKSADGSRPEAATIAEGEAILRAIAPNDHVWLLERDGIELTSVELAQRLERAPVDGISRITIVVAGAYGASPAVLERAN